MSIVLLYNFIGIYLKDYKMVENFDTDIKIKRGEILKYLHDLEDYDFSYKDLDNLFGVTDGAVWKIANSTPGRYLSKSHIIALDYEYNIPKELFLGKNKDYDDNEDITSSEDIDLFLEEFHSRKKGDLIIKNFAPRSIEKLKLYEYFYIYDKDTDDVIERTISIIDNYITFFKVEVINNKTVKVVNFEGHIYSTPTSILGITENPITGNNILFKIQRISLLGHIIPISYMGHRTKSNEEVAGFGICTRVPMKDIALNILKMNENVFSKKKNILIENIRKAERHL